MIFVNPPCSGHSIGNSVARYREGKIELACTSSCGQARVWVWLVVALQCFSLTHPRCRWGLGYWIKREVLNAMKLVPRIASREEIPLWASKSTGRIQYLSLSAGRNDPFIELCILFRLRIPKLSDRLVERFLGSCHSDCPAIDRPHQLFLPYTSEKLDKSRTGIL